MSIYTVSKEKVFDIFKWKVNFLSFRTERTCTKTDLAEEAYPIEACCGDDGDIPPPPPPPPGGNN